MNALKTLGTTFDTAIVPTLRANSIGKTLMPVNPDYSNKGLGFLQIENFKYVARGDARINYDIQQDMGDGVDIESQVVKIPVQQDDAVIKRRDWDAYNLKGVSIETDLATDMAANIANKQTSLIVNGWSQNGTTYEIKGLYPVAGNTVAGSDSGTFGGILKSVAGAISKLKEDKIYSAGYNAVLSSFTCSELDGSISNGVAESELILKILNRSAGGGQPGQIIESPDLVGGTGFVSPVATPENKRFFDLAETVIPKNQLWFDQGNVESGDICVRQVGAIVPRFKHLKYVGGSWVDDCVCTITAMGSS